MRNESIIKRRFIAIDLGAESGRAVVGMLDNDRLSLEEIHRFPNEPVEIRGTLHWDALNLYNSILKGLGTYAQRFGKEVDGIGIDTWGVDFGLLAEDGSLLQNPVHYRDRRTEGIMGQILEKTSRLDLFQKTGMSLYSFQTLPQLVSLCEQRSPALKAAATLLMMPDLFAYFLTGRKQCERTSASITQLYDPHNSRWDGELFDTFDLPLYIMPDLVAPGSSLETLSNPVTTHTGLKQATVIDVCTHDTASAVAAVPAIGNDWAFISSGTWSVLGTLTDYIVTSNEALDAELCNEISLHSSFLCRNIMGLWILQCVRAQCERQGESYSYSDLTKLAENTTGNVSLIDPNDSAFFSPENMTASIRYYCEETGQPPPQGAAETVRCVLESLALSYQHTLKQIENILSREFRVIHIVGGGSLNKLLCQFTANATGIEVIAGPVEATVVGNILAQALALGYIGTPSDIRDIVRKSSSLVQYEPRDTPYWQERYGRYMTLLQKTEN